jgi:hypothetical protein
MNPLLDRPARTIVAALGLAALVYLVGYVGIWRWGICRVEVPPGSSLLLRYKGPWPFTWTVSQAPEGTLVRTGPSGLPSQMGILAAMPGPGRHFYSPLEFETQLVKDVIIPPGKIGVVVSKGGKPLPAGAYLVDDDGYRGILRRVLTPGRYRINPYGFDVSVVDVDACVEPRTRGRRKQGDPTLIPPGYVGVVTNKAENPATRQGRGIQSRVLQPGIYFLNPEEKRVDLISVGFAETTLLAEVQGTPAAGPATAGLAQRGDRLGKAGGGREPVYVAGKGIEFPSNDGFLIHLDYTAIWGITPEQAPDVVRQFGTLGDVEQKVILPQIGSICRLHGSKRGAVDLLVGDSREAFQDETARELERVLAAKDLTLLFGLTRHIYVPSQVREPIQRAKIADELTRTRDQERLTAQEQAELTEAKAKVTLEERRTNAATEKLSAQVAAEGEKRAREIEATTERLKAEIDARTAAIQAQTTKVLGEAKARTTELIRQAEADRFSQYVRALGGPDAYNKYVFAEGLPPDLRLGIFYAGPGTFWTDLKGFEQAMLGKLASEPRPDPAPAAPAAARRP